jgi:dephospho-CoA kinase
MNKQLRIIGLAGTNGSGKDSIGQFLAERHNYLFVSVTDLLRTELKNRGLAITRENMRNLSAGWRRERGLGVLINAAMDNYGAVKGKYAGIAIASLRNPGEADRIHELGGLVIWVDADPLTRYERIQANAKARGRAGEDNKSYEQFLAEEASEMKPVNDGDNTVLNMSAVKELSDVQIDNSKKGSDNLQASVEEVLGL